MMDFFLICITLVTRLYAMLLTLQVNDVLLGVFPPSPAAAAEPALLQAVQQR
jgi:hypothetical protein